MILSIRWCWYWFQLFPISCCSEFPKWPRFKTPKSWVCTGFRTCNSRPECKRACGSMRFWLVRVSQWDPSDIMSDTARYLHIFQHPKVRWFGIYKAHTIIVSLWLAGEVPCEFPWRACHFNLQIALERTKLIFNYLNFHRQSIWVQSIEYKVWHIFTETNAMIDLWNEKRETSCEKSN